MRRSLITISITLILACLLIPGLFADEKRPVTIEDIFTLKGIREVELSPDGSSILYVVSVADFKENTYNTDIWKIPSSGGEPIQMTTNAKRDYHPRWSPDGRMVAFLSNRDGRTQIWLISSFAGEAYRLTDSKTGVSTFVWSPCGKKIAYLAPQPPTKEEERRKKEKEDVIVVDKDFKMNCLWLIDVSTREVKQLTKGDFHINSFDWSPKGGEIAFSAQPTPKVADSFNSDLYLISLKEGETRKLVERPGPDSSPRWSPDGKMIAFISQDGKTDWFVNSYICVVPVAGGAPVNISQSLDEQVNFFRWGPEGKNIFFLGPTTVTFNLFSIPATGGKPQRITSGEFVYGNFSFSRDFSKVAFTRQSPSEPEELYTSDFPRFSPHKLTDLNPQIQDLALGETTLVHWKSVDGWDMEGLLIKPVGYQPGNKYPLLTVIHCEPADCFVYDFALRRTAYPVQVFAGEGYAIFLPNPRGSGNYGEEFRSANYRDWGGNDYQDIMTGVDYLIKEGIADPDRLGVMGWSYAGYMTSWAITQTSRFKAASVGAGMPNLYSFYGQTDIPEFMESYFGGPPWEEMKVYLDHSAMYHINKAVTPTLIQHGAEDRRVPLSQAKELYQGLKRNNVPVEFVIYPRQPHGIREPKLQKDVVKRNLDWFNKWLRGVEEKK
ncbi:peptidase S9 family protein [bacterium (candidate division B38) B3_B38]|nr:MAG: peptidase S9 family protein [bacterium (candidate division B38) B3_B38]